MINLPAQWHCDAFTFANARESDTTALLTLFNEQESLRSLDNSFAAISESDMRAMISDGIGMEGFQFQSIRGLDRDIAYFHVLHQFRGDETLAFISMFLLSRPLQGQGYGKRLFSAIKLKLKSLGYSRIWLKVASTNVAALGFWFSQGFTNLIDVLPDADFPTRVHLVLGTDLASA